MKLLEIAKKLGVGINSCWEVLRDKGYYIDNNPNVKVNEEQRNILYEVFKEDLLLKNKIRQKKQDEFDIKIKKIISFLSKFKDVNSDIVYLNYFKESCEKLWEN